MTVSSWEELSGQLADRLPALEVDDVVILAAPGNKYTELVQLEGRIALDAVSNTFLPPGEQLTADQERQLQELGWQPPEPPFRPLWWHEVDKWPLQSSEVTGIVELMVSTMRDVYRVADPADVEVRSFRS